MTRPVPMDWEAFEQAFRNNARRVYSYLHVPTGEVIRVVRCASRPAMHASIATDPSYVLITPATPRQQHVWLRDFARSVQVDSLRASLMNAIHGARAFANFKAVLASHPAERARWLAFRYERRRSAMEQWFTCHGLAPLDPPPEYVPCPNEAASPCRGPCTCARNRACRADLTDDPCRGDSDADALRRELDTLATALGPYEIDALSALADLIVVHNASRVD